MQGFIAGAGEIQAQDINDTLRQNYMPYAMSVIMSRAIPEIDGFKPSHRKLLYTMYKMNLLGSAHCRTEKRAASRFRCKKSALRQDRLAFRLCRRVACAAERSVLLKGGQHTVRTMDCAARPGKTPLV